MTPLFRPEAVRAQQQLWLGQVQIARPLSLSWLVAAVTVLALATGAFLALGQYTRKAQVSGVLVPDRGLIRMVPTAPGTVLERHVDEGQRVRAGDLLFVLAQDRDDRDDAVQAELRRNVLARQRSLAQVSGQQRALADARTQTLDRRLSALDSEAARLDVELTIHQRRQDLAKQAQARLAALQRQAFVSPAQLQAKDEEVLALEAQFEQLERQRQTLQREREQIDGERREIPLALAGTMGALEREQAELAREQTIQEGVRRIQVRALQDGVVSAVLAEPGQVLASPMALATLVPAGSTLQAQLFAPSRAMGFIKPGQVVRLRFEAYPYQKYGHRAGRVLQVSRVPLSTPELALHAGLASASEPMFRITVALDPAGAAQESLSLSAGMRLTADVQLERRRLIEWLFAPILGLEDRL